MQIDKLFRWVGWYRLPGLNRGPLDPQSRTQSHDATPDRLVRHGDAGFWVGGGDTPKRPEMAEHDKNGGVSPYKSPYSEAADHARRNHEDPLRAARGCFWWGVAGIAFWAVVGIVWIWRVM